MVAIILTVVIVGLVAGFLARAIVPGKDAMGILPTLLLGLVGSAIGAVLVHFIPALNFKFSGIVLPVVGAIIALLIYNRFVAKKA